MKKQAFIATFILFATSAGFMTQPAAAFISVQRVPILASVTVSSGTSLSSLIIQAQPLPTQAFFGKNLIIPITVTSTAGPISPDNLQVTIVYQLQNPTGGSLNPPTPVLVQFTQDPTNPAVLQGTALIPRSELSGVQSGGNLTYIFAAQQGRSGAVLNIKGLAPALFDIATSSALPSPFQTEIINQVCSPVGAAGARVSAPDLSEGDGETSVFLPQGAVASSGNLCIQAEDASNWPLGPGNSPAAAVYSVSLQDTTLVGSAQLVLSYPSDTTGKVLGSEAEPSSLGIYWLDKTAAPQINGIWQPLSRAALDSTLHTLTGMTGHFSTFALFTAGAIGSVDLRPPQRIITPNGDGINDKAIFGSGIDEVKIFDVRGRRVKHIAGPSPVWDGTDDSGKIVESGVYIYQYTAQGDRVSGVIAVAK